MNLPNIRPHCLYLITDESELLVNISELLANFAELLNHKLLKLSLAHFLFHISPVYHDLLSRQICRQARIATALKRAIARHPQRRIRRMPLRAVHCAHMETENTLSVPQPAAAPSPQITHTLTIPEVVTRFADAGVPRAERTIQTYCKSGTLDAIQVPGELGPKYLVSETSVENRIREFVQMRDLLESTPGASGARQSAFQRASTRSSAQERATADAVADEEDENAKAAELLELRKQLAAAESDVRARDAFINMLQNEKKEQFEMLFNYTNKIAEQSRELGRLEERLSLAPPPQHSYPHTPTGEETVRDVE